MQKLFLVFSSAIYASSILLGRKNSGHEYGHIDTVGKHRVDSWEALRPVYASRESVLHVLKPVVIDIAYIQRRT